ncbi:MAG: transketolase C-terminal domain-containing protein [Eubacteriales bacterium]|nr:transketolase C-terminal domain-containing protein [Eubacteriales bacterium]
MASVRQAICQTLLELAEQDRDIVVLASDSRGSASLAPFAKAYPERFVEVGIAEQDLVGIAAGLAHSGKKPVAASPACFLTMRAIEQVKVDVAYSRMPVLLYGISGGLSYGALGMTHHSLQDIATLCAIPGIDVMLPADQYEAAAMVREWMANPRPAYLRVGRNPVPDVFGEENCNYVPGRATVLREGGDACVIAVGEMVYPAREAARMLAQEGVEVRVLDMHTVKPLDEQAVREACDTGLIVTMEEHSCFGGLGSLVCQAVCGFRPTPVRVLAVPDEPVITGTSAQVFAHYGLTAGHLADVIREGLGGNRERRG